MQDVRVRGADLTFPTQEVPRALKCCSSVLSVVLPCCHAQCVLLGSCGGMLRACVFVVL